MLDWMQVSEVWQEQPAFHKLHVKLPPTTGELALLSLMLLRFRTLYAAAHVHAFRSSILIVHCSLFIHLPYPCFYPIFVSALQRLAAKLVG
jgi:hypothetical protein